MCTASALQDVEAFEKPVAVMPNIGGPGDSYFLVKERVKWKQDFVRWLNAAHERVEDDVADIDAAPVANAEPGNEAEETANSDSESDDEDDKELFVVNAELSNQEKEGSESGSDSDDEEDAEIESLSSDDAELSWTNLPST